jgi:hypothetical protein
MMEGYYVLLSTLFFLYNVLIKNCKRIENSWWQAGAYIANFAWYILFLFFWWSEFHKEKAEAMAFSEKNFALRNKSYYFNQFFLITAISGAFSLITFCVYIYKVASKKSREKRALFEAEIEYQRAIFEAEMKHKNDMFEAENDYDSESEAENENDDSTGTDQRTAKFQAEMSRKRALFEAEMQLKSRFAPLNIKTDRDRALDRVKKLSNEVASLKEQRRRESLQQLVQLPVPVTELQIKEIELDIAVDAANQYNSRHCFEPAGETDTYHLNEMYCLLRDNAGLIKRDLNAAYNQGVQ